MYIAFQEQRQQPLNLLTSRNLLTISKGFSSLYRRSLPRIRILTSAIKPSSHICFNIRSVYYFWRYKKSLFLLSNPSFPSCFGIFIYHFYLYETKGNYEGNNFLEFLFIRDKEKLQREKFFSIFIYTGLWLFFLERWAFLRFCTVVLKSFSITIHKPNVV